MEWEAFRCLLQCARPPAPITWHFRTQQVFGASVVPRPHFIDKPTQVWLGGQTCPGFQEGDGRARIRSWYRPCVGLLLNVSLLSRSQDPLSVEFIAH